LDVGIDLHLDEHLDAGALYSDLAADLSIQHGLQGRVALSHVCNLSQLPDDRRRAVAQKLATAGITVITLPGTNLYLQDRGARTPRQRGVTIVQELASSGVPVLIGSDNVQDAFLPFGNADPLEAAYLGALAAQVNSTDALIAGICGGQARISEGDRADLVLLPVVSVEQAIAERPPRHIMKAGEPI
jgi:cytosine deaminase